MGLSTPSPFLGTAAAPMHHALGVNRHLLPSAELRELAGLQSGVITREQALAHGLSDDSLQRIVAQGWWRRLRRGVFFTSAAAPGWRALAWAGVLIGGDEARLHGSSAAFELRLVREEPYPIDIAVGRECHVRSDYRWRFTKSRRLGHTRGTLPRTTTEDTVLDLITAEPDSMAGLVTDAVNRRLTTIPRLRSAAKQRSRMPRRPELDLLLADVGEGNQSPLELLYYRQVERAHQLPKGRRQVRQGNNTILDVAYGAEGWRGGLVVELDGRRGHSGSGAFRDMHRDNYHADRGVLTLRFGWADCTARPCEVARQVAARLAGLGWSGQLRPCRSCDRLTQ